MQIPDSGQVLQKTIPSPFVETLAYDSVWTLALALNRTMNMINTNDTLNCPLPVPLEEFSYGNSSTACLIRNSLSNTNFTGLSVSIHDIAGDIYNTRSPRVKSTLENTESVSRQLSGCYSIGVVSIFCAIVRLEVVTGLCSTHSFIRAAAQVVCNCILGPIKKHITGVSGGRKCFNCVAQ